MTDAILWWTGAIVWGLIGGSIIMVLMILAAVVIGFVTYRMGGNIARDIAATRPRTRKVRP